MINLWTFITTYHSSLSVFMQKRHPVARRGIVKVPNQKVARQSKCTGLWLHHHDHCHAQMQSVCHTTLWSCTPTKDHSNPSKVPSACGRWDISATCIQTISTELLKVQDIVSFFKVWLVPSQCSTSTLGTSHQFSERQWVKNNSHSTSRRPGLWTTLLTIHRRCGWSTHQVTQKSGVSLLF